MSCKALNSYLQPQIIKHYNLKIGDFYFFENFVLIEYAENAHISLLVLKTIMRVSKIFFPNSKPFGLIINKIHSFSTVPSDAFKLENELPNLVATAVVTWDSALSINFELENHFFKKINRRLFPDIKTAETWIQAEVNAAKI